MLCTHPREAQRAEICLRHFGGYAGDITLTILESSALGGVKRRGSRLAGAPPPVGRSVRRPQLAPRAGAVSFGWFIFVVARGALFRTGPARISMSFVRAIRDRRKWRR